MRPLLLTAIAIAGTATVGFLIAAVQDGGNDSLWIGLAVSPVILAVFLSYFGWTMRNYAPPPDRRLPEDWWLEADSPTFRIDPGIDNNLSQDRQPKLLLTLYQLQGSGITLNAEWGGDGIDDGSVTIMDHPIRRGDKQAWQFKPKPIHLYGDEGIVDLHIWFRWRDATCHSHWKWPVVRHDEGHLELRSTANNVQPAERSRVLLD